MAASRPMNRQKIMTIAYWVTTIFGPASFVIGGFLFLTRDPQVLANNVRLGYPPYFVLILGLWKVLGAVAVVVPRFPRLKEWAYAGFFFELTGAAASHSLAGDGIADILTPLGFLVLVVASWALRPESRRLGTMGF